MLFFKRHSVFDRIHLFKDFTLTEKIAQNNVKRKEMSQETKNKISIANKNKPKSEEHKKALSKIKKDLFSKGILESPSYWKGKKHSEEYKKKLSEINKGNNQREKNGMWQGGISFAPYSPEFNNTLRREIREKYNNKCFLTGKESKKRALAVHHINYNKQDCREINLVPLLDDIHQKTAFNRDYWFALFCYLKNIDSETMVNGGI